MNKINNLSDFLKLSNGQKQKIYNDNIKEIEKYIYTSQWYNKMSDKLKKEVKKNKPWLLYYNKNNDTPVRLYGYAENNTENNAKNKEDISYLVCTMEDDETNSLCYGVLEDINRISSVSWENINNTYIDNLKKSIPYGGDMIFLKPEMFLFVSKYHIR